MSKKVPRQLYASAGFFDRDSDNSVLCGQILKEQSKCLSSIRNISTIPLCDARRIYNYIYASYTHHIPHRIILIIIITLIR